MIPSALTETALARKFKHPKGLKCHYTFLIETACVCLALTLLVRSPEPRWIGAGASLGFLIAFLLLFSLMKGDRHRWMEHAARES